ncbi:MAG: ribonuclease P protein component [Flavobacteriales bacterium]
MPEFKKSERLCGKKSFEKLFSKGKKFFVHPFKVQYLYQDNETSAKRIGVVVSKKIVKRANKRNRLKRQIREAYRLEKESFLINPALLNKGIDFAVIYIGEEKTSLAFLREKINLILARLSRDCVQ